MTSHKTAELMLADYPTWFTGTSRAMITLEGVIAEIAPTNIPILFVGESGTGKEIFAHRVHRLSGNSQTPLIRVSCGSVRSNEFLTEAGLNSYRQEQQSTGSRTLFLDEIADLDASYQRDLLCALPDGDGESRRGTFNTRLISTTSRNLDEEMRAGRFRSDLYYRISCICLRLPPLRERKDDIPPLFEFFLAKHAVQLGRHRPALSAESLELLANYSWPGNIRELENVAKKVVALGDESLALAGLSTRNSKVATPAENAHQTYSLKAAARAASREAERELILKALSRTRWNRKRAARELQISYKSLLYKLKQIGVDEVSQ
jgi:two-component system, NtrC family, response regulator AtoC